PCGGLMALFFFSSRRRHTRWPRDWSSDVCSSDLTFPGCIYSEMKMCLAPCFSGCTKEEYDVEVNRLVEFLETSGGSLRTAFEQERERASEQLDFERARTLHKKVEKLDEVLRGRPEITRRIQDLHAVILQRTA